MYIEMTGDHQIPLFKPHQDRGAAIEEMGNFAKPFKPTAKKVRPSSVDAYCELIESGRGDTQIARIYEFLLSRAPMSLREIQKGLAIDINAVSGRVNRMKKKGLLEECKKRRCRESGKLIIPVTVAKD